jgi:hypothetical protein
MGWSKGGGWGGQGWSAPADAAATTAFLARTSGLSGTETAAYKALINGLVADGVFALLDALYIFATNTTTTANLNLISTSFGLTKTGTVTFTADQGYTGDGSTGFLDTGYVPFTAGLNYSQNSASFGAYVRGGRTTANNALTVMGTQEGGVKWAYLVPLTAASTAGADINGETFPNFTLPSNTANGLVSVVRTSSGSTNAYKNASSTSLGTPTDGSDGLSTNSFYICAYNSDGPGGNFSTDQISAAYIGGGITGAQHLLLSNRINAFMTALGINVY